MNEPIITFVVEGEPATQGSKNPVVPTYKDGTPVRRHKRGCPAFGDKTLARDGMPDGSGEWKPFECGCPIMVNVLDQDGKKLASWREIVGLTARNAYKGELLDSALVASFVFHQPRPKGHYGTGRNERILKDSAPAYPAIMPDVLKLARAVEDALRGVIVTDDARFVDEHLGKRYVDRWEPYRVEVMIRPAEHQTVGDLVFAGLLEAPAVDEIFDGQLALV